MIPRVEMHQTASVMMGDRIVKCISTLPNDNKGGTHQTESTRNCELNSQGEIANIDECNGIFMYMHKSHELNCELNYCIENACCYMINDLNKKSMQN